MTKNRGRFSYPRRSLMLATLTAPLTLAVSMAHAQELQQGRDFNVINPPQPTDIRGKIEVIEFFWYGCNHCHALEGPLEAWRKKLPSDVAFRRVPAVFNEGWAVAARVFYTIEAMGQFDKLHTPLFDAIHKGNMRINNEGAVEDWLLSRGVDVAEYRKQSRSFVVDGRVRRATQMTEAYKFDAVPTLVVNCRYATISAGPDLLLRRVDGLIERARRDPSSNVSSKK